MFVIVKVIKNIIPTIPVLVPVKHNRMMVMCMMKKDYHCKHHIKIVDNTKATNELYEENG